ncbi:DUF4157 domain-containing protein [Cellulomonas sp. Leaf334]|uniref:eCIS core domain-containing protein n=1 Tax=Cellulomonas sp. Leaf334 TaxID=1736339 RepID=UPI0006FCA4F9|nr:DUF4157 domain-containing protein [Cellulomonas sp. Leaf334]KQR12284.1 hypothetical protein ASF78_14180 [Cellulomonas sp. Leaf334]
MRDFATRPAAEARAPDQSVQARFARVVDHDTARERDADAEASAVRGLAPRQGTQVDGSLDRPTQEFFGQRYHHDFSQVRVHADGRAAAVAGALGASAMTVGNDVYLGRGETGTHRGDLLAHELTHVVQQSRAGRPVIQRKLFATGSAADFAAAANGIIAVQFEVVVSRTGEVTLRRTDVQGPLTPEAQELVRVIEQVSADANDTTLEFIHGQTSARASDAMVLGGNFGLSRVDLDDVAALGSQGAVGVGMGRTGGSLLAHEILEQYRKQVHGEDFGPAHAAASASENTAVGGTRGAERFTNRVDVNNFTVTIPYTYPDGHVVEVTWDVVNGNYQNVRRSVVTPPRAMGGRPAARGTP